MARSEQRRSPALGATGRFPRCQRLRGRSSFRQVFAYRSSAADQHLVVYARPNGLAYSRLGLTVSRKVGAAVQRNRWKRRVREAFRRNKAQLPIGFDLVVVARVASSPTYDQVVCSLVALARIAARRGRRRGQP